MERAITDLLQFSDNRLFEEIARGVDLIVANAESLESMAVRFVKLGEHRAAGIARALAAEESAKVLILVDVVRCPPDEQANRARTLRGFYRHLEKRIYTEACWWRSADFAEVKRAIDRERLPYYLDGPIGFDWILPNSARSTRELQMYVDYARDITSEVGARFWVSPLDHEHREYERHTPTSLVVARALHRIGMTTPEGLSIVAGIWRAFRPKPQTTFPQLSRVIDHTLACVIGRGLGREADLHAQAVIQHWPFPLWSLDLTLSDDPKPDALRKERDAYIDWRKKVEAQRNPPPQISRNKVEALSKAYDDWSAEDQQLRETNRDKEAGTTLAIPTSRVMEELASLESYQELKRAVSRLTMEERMDLAALGWFGRDRESGWEFFHAHARRVISEESTDYICGLGSYWLSGLERWEAEPELPASLREGIQRR